MLHKVGQLWRFAEHSTCRRCDSSLVRGVGSICWSVLTLSEAAMLLHALLGQRLADALPVCCRQSLQMSGCLMICWPGTRLVTLDNGRPVILCGRAPAAATTSNQDLRFWRMAWHRPTQQTLLITSVQLPSFAATSLLLLLHRYMKGLLISPHLLGVASWGHPA